MKRKIRYGKVQVGAAVLLSSLLLSSCSGAKQTAYNDSAANSVYKEEAELSGVGGEQSGLAKSSGAEAENGERGTSSDYAEGNLQNEIPTNDRDQYRYGGSFRKEDSDRKYKSCR